MKKQSGFWLGLLLLGAAVYGQENPSVKLENLTWFEAEKKLKNYQVVAFALGARTKEHGPHLQLNNDYIMVVSTNRTH